MEESVRKTLADISAGAPRPDVTRDVIDTSEEDVARQIVENPSTPPATRRRIQKEIDRGSFMRIEIEENSEAIAENDRYHETEVKKAIDSGILPDPAQDPFVKTRLQRMKQGKFAIVGDGIVQPVRGRVLVRPVKDPFERPSVIIRIKEPRKRLQYATLMAIGPDVRISGAEIGDTILHRAGYDDFFVQNDHIRVVDADSVVGKLL